MVLVAIAGASSGLGLTFLRVLAQDKTALQKHRFILLSRSAQPQWDNTLDVRPVDYTKHDQLVHALQGVHTIISFMGNASGVDGQVSVINAAKDAGVKRFAPSEFAGDGPYDMMDAYKPKEVVWNAAKAAGLEVTQFQTGLFMSVLATGTPKPVTEVGRAEGLTSGEDEALGGLRPWNYILNMKAGTADLVGDGSAEMSMTDTRDIARFVIAAIDLPHWPDKLGMRGSDTTYKEIIAYVEKVQGRKFLIKENSIAELQAVADSMPEARFYNQSRIAIDKGYMLIEPTLNKAFPDIKPMTMEEFVDRWWSGVDLPEPSWVEDKAFSVGD